MASGGGVGGRGGSGSRKKGPTKGTGGHGRKRLEGRGPTPKAQERTGHPAKRRAAAAAKRTTSPPPSDRRPRARRDPGADEVVAGRNPVVEALRAGVPAKTLYVASGMPHDERVTESLKRALAAQLPVREVTKPDLDRITQRAVHQGLALTVPPYAYEHPDDLLRRAGNAATPALLVALDGVTDPHNLGAVVRSAAAFGAHGVVVPERRSAGMTAAAWKASAGAAARLPVARATNLVRTLAAYADAGLMVVGLDADAALALDDLDVAGEPLCLVVGAEGGGLSRLVRERCDLLVAIPMDAASESLNASVAAGILLAEVARRRRG